MDENWRSPADSVCCDTKPQAVRWWCCSSLCCVCMSLKWWETTCAAFSSLWVNIILILIHRVFFLAHLCCTAKTFPLLIPGVNSSLHLCWGKGWMLILNTDHMSMLYISTWSGHTSINHTASQQQAGRPIDFLFALGMEDIWKKKAEPAHHCAAEIPLRGYCSQAWFVTDVLMRIRCQIHPNLPSTSTRQRGTNTKLYSSSPEWSIPQVLMSCGSKLAKNTLWGRKLFFQ